MWTYRVIFICFVGCIKKMSYLCIQTPGRADGCSPRAVRSSKNWFRATDGLSGHEFTVGAAPLAALSRLFTAFSPNIKRSGRNGGSSLMTVNSPDKAARGA